MTKELLFMEVKHVLSVSKFQEFEGIYIAFGKHGDLQKRFDHWSWMSRFESHFFSDGWEVLLMWLEQMSVIVYIFFAIARGVSRLSGMNPPSKVLRVNYTFIYIHHSRNIKLPNILIIKFFDHVHIFFSLWKCRQIMVNGRTRQLGVVHPKAII